MAFSRDFPAVTPTAAWPVKSTLARKEQGKTPFPTIGKIITEVEETSAERQAGMFPKIPTTDHNHLTQRRKENRSA
jgi:hypothetical protein